MLVSKKLFDAKIGAEIRGYIKGTLTYKEAMVTTIGGSKIQRLISQIAPVDQKGLIRLVCQIKEQVNKLNKVFSCSRKTN